MCVRYCHKLMKLRYECVCVCRVRDFILFGDLEFVVQSCCRCCYYDIDILCILNLQQSTINKAFLICLEVCVYRLLLWIPKHGSTNRSGWRRKRDKIKSTNRIDGEGKIKLKYSSWERNMCTSVIEHRSYCCDTYCIQLCNGNYCVKWHTLYASLYIRHFFLYVCVCAWWRASLSKQWMSGFTFYAISCVLFYKYRLNTKR